MTKAKKISTWLAFLALAGAVIVIVLINRRYPAPVVEPVNSYNSVSQSPLNSGADQPANQNSDTVLKSAVSLPVPFTPQAPTANWDELHNEACEEASSLMTDAYFKGLKENTLTPQYAEKEITRLTEWQKQNQGYYLDQTSAEVAKMISEVYGLKTELKTNFTENDLKQALSEGKVVIMSFAGRLLGNPYYKSPGPLHHMIVIKGYTSSGFITNDPGTKRGANYPYSFATLKAASADWDHSTHDMDMSKKIAIIVWK